MDFITYAAAVKAARKGVPYVEEGGMVEILPETEGTRPDPMESYYTVPIVLSFTIGETYIVNYNGTDYTCVAQSGASLGFGAVVGNLGKFAGTGVEETGEPFLLLPQPDQTNLIIHVFNIPDSVTIAIYGEGVKAHKIDPRCLPDGTPYVQEGVLFAETSAESFTDPTSGEAWGISGAVPHLTIGETYTINYNGTPYKCVCQAAPDGVSPDPNAVAMGNFAAIGGTDTGEPFAMLIMVDYQRLVVLDFVGSTAVKVGILGGIPHKMDARCLPDEAASLYNVYFNGDGSGDVSTDQTFEEVFAKATNPNIIVRAIYSFGSQMYVAALNMVEEHQVLFSCSMTSDSGLVTMSLYLDHLNQVTVSISQHS